MLTEITKVKTSDCKPDPNNPNLMTPAQMASLKASISEYGDLQPIVIDQDNNILDGAHFYKYYPSIIWYANRENVPELRKKKINDPDHSQGIQILQQGMYVRISDKKQITKRSEKLNAWKETPRFGEDEQGKMAHHNSNKAKKGKIIRADIWGRKGAGNKEKNRGKKQPNQIKRRKMEKGRKPMVGWWGRQQTCHSKNNQAGNTCPGWRQMCEMWFKRTLRNTSYNSIQDMQAPRNLEYGNTMLPVPQANRLWNSQKHYANTKARLIRDGKDITDETRRE